jgi:hypothetical protein
MYTQGLMASAPIERTAIGLRTVVTASNGKTLLFVISIAEH